MCTGDFNAGGNPAMDWRPIQGGVEIFLVASCYRNREKLRPDEPLGSYADFTFTFTYDVTFKMFFTILQDNQDDGKLHVETSVGSQGCRGWYDLYL